MIKYKRQTEINIKVLGSTLNRENSQLWFGLETGNMFETWEEIGRGSTSFKCEKEFFAFRKF